jgi:RCD1-SRO-TAF4 (RST) plant domain
MNNEAGPRSPWMSFTGLFAEIQDDLCPIARELLALNYDELKVTLRIIFLIFRTLWFFCELLESSTLFKFCASSRG